MTTTGNTQSPDSQGLTELLELLGGHGRGTMPSESMDLAAAGWDAVAAQAWRHRVVPQLFTKISGNWPSGMSADLRTTIDRYARTLSLNALYMKAELFRIQEALDGENIPAVSFKGPILGEMAYGDASCREFGDLDIMVQPSEYPRAKRVLEQRGLRPKFSSELEQRIGQTHLCSADERLSIDLHQRLASRIWPGALDAAHLWKYTTEHTLDGGTVTTFTPAATLVICCLQPMKSSWRMLYHLLDIAALVNLLGDEGVCMGLEVASSLRMRRIYLVGLLAANDLLSVKLPDDVRDAATIDAAAKRFVPEVRENLFGGEPPRHILRHKHRTCLLMRDSAIERTVFTLRIAPKYLRKAFSSNEADRNWVVLPGFLEFLYPAVRIVRLLTREIRRRANPGAETTKRGGIA